MLWFSLEGRSSLTLRYFVQLIHNYLYQVFGFQEFF